MPFSSYSFKYSHPLEFIYSDLWGPSPITGNGEYRYYIHFTDHFSHFIWIFPLHKKSDALFLFILFKLLIEKLLGLQIKQLQSDGGGEYKKFKHFLTSNGILHYFSSPYTHAQNGLAECMHRHLVEIELTLFARASVPLSY